ncbi:MAG: D-aminoacyl-tRNA deacylase [Dehalococcoidales bacterium]|nr:D-aminoacyl-tRNA deacylase [Dehalococcoidales bacterium]MDD3265414.1 D-aminoacyl-tRNA deacylase [Dehalococcoidales bacterium]MDD4323016.1 D-aminoacyl-tRNA deacylase [Dehalococcoidales bacterium]MDD4794217.1 D-aminoacyl-tRNA deacylase [Dehalococcoidales bacterium]MDD5498468.1 D-aminoacyl-tRNA deacylase [Dehalococcoidales bacterium]
MKALIQRVSSASVIIEGETTGSIGHGLCVLAGIADGDCEEDIDYIANKILNLRIFADDSDKFNFSVKDIRGELLLVSQFTLMADSRKGRRPSFTRAAPPREAEKLFELFTDKCRASGLKTQTGRFQAMMRVHIVNEGPVTIMLDSKER